MLKITESNLVAFSLFLGQFEAAASKMIDKFRAKTPKKIKMAQIYKIRKIAQDRATL